MTMLKWVKLVLPAFLLCFIIGAGPVQAQVLDKPWEEWTEEELLATGWTPYGDDAVGTPGDGGGGEAIGPTRWLFNDGNPLGTCVTFSFASPPPAHVLDVGANSFPGLMPLGTAFEVTVAAATWAAAADIHFFPGVDSNIDWDLAGALQDIRVASENIDGPLGVLAHAFLPPPMGVTAAGDLHFDDKEAWRIPAVGAGPPFDVLTVALHELGHSLGLTHASTVMADVMFPMYMGPKTVLNPLAGGDIALITTIYGVAGAAHPGGVCPAPFDPPEPPPLPQQAMVPALSTGGLVLFLLLVLAGGLIVRPLRRRRRQV